MLKLVNNKLVGRVSQGASYNGESIPGQLNTWSIMDTDPNDFLKFTYDDISSKSWTLYNTYSPIASAIEKRLSFAIGKGLKFKSTPDFETLGITQEEATEWAKKLQVIIDLAFDELNLYDLQQQIWSTSEILGDALIQIIPDEEGIIPFAFKVFSGTDVIDYTVDDNSTTLGIILDKYKQPIGFIDKDKKNHYFKKDGNLNSILWFNQQVANQFRGYPLAYKIIGNARDHARLWDSTLQRSVLESLLLGTETVNDNIAEQINVLAAEQKKKNPIANFFSRISNTKDLGTGNILKVAAKGNLQFMDLKTPNDRFKSFNDAFLEIISMATAVPVEILMSKYSTSYFAARAAHNDFFKTILRLRTNFVNKVLYPILTTVVKSLIANKYIDAIVPEMLNNPIAMRAALQGQFLGPRIDALNPLQEAQSLILLKDNKILTPSSVAEHYNNDVDYDSMVEQWQREMSLVEENNTTTKTDTASDAESNPEDLERSKQQGGH